MLAMARRAGGVGVGGSLPTPLPLTIMDLDGAVDQLKATRSAVRLQEIPTKPVSAPCSQFHDVFHDRHTHWLLLLEKVRISTNNCV